jgi:tetratricopeptide (TPR) repeat protein
VGVVPEGLPLAENVLPDPMVEASLAMTLGRLYADELENPALAIRSFEKALPFREDDSELLKTLLALYKKVGDSERAMLTYDRLCGAWGEFEGKRQVLLEKAGYAEGIGNHDYAIEALHRILELRREDEEVREYLERLLLTNGRFDELVQFLDGELAIETDPQRQAEILFEMATIYRDNLNKPVEASLCLRRCLTEHPDFSEAEDASIGLILEKGGTHYAEVTTSLLDVLESRLRGREDARQTFVKILDTKASVAQTPWEKALAYSEMAEVEHALGNMQNYYSACEKAFLCMPDDPKLLEKLVSSASLAGNEARMCEVLEEAGEQVRSSEAKVAVWLEAAKAYRDKLSDLPKAMTIYDRLLEVSPQSPQILREMDALLKEMGRDAERIPLLEEVARLVATVEERRDIYLSIGGLCLKTGDLEGAVRAFNYVFERRPQESELDEMSKDAVGHLLTLYENLGRYKSLVALRLQLGEMTEGQEAKEHYFRAGCLLHEQVKDLEQAKMTFAKVLEIAPMEPDALSKAKAVAREALDYEYLEKLLREEIEVCKDTKKRHELLLELADVLDAMGDVRVLEPLSLVLADDPAHPEATRFVVRLLSNDVVALNASRLLEDAASRLNDDNLLLKALETQVKFSTSSEEEVATKLKVVEALKRLQRMEDALKGCTDMFIAYPENETVFKKLISELRQASRLEGIVEITREASSNANDPVALRLRVAGVLLDENMSEGAIALLGDNIDAQSDHRPSLECMVNAQRQANSPDGVVWALEMLAKTTQDETETASLFRECGRIAKEQLHDLPRARQFYQDCLTYAPLDREALQNLREIVEKMGDRKGLQELLRHELSHLEGVQGVVEEIRKNEIRRALCGFALESGDMDEATSLAFEMLKSSQVAREDLFVAKDVYLKAQYPYPIFSLLVEKCSGLQAQDCLLEVLRGAGKANIAEPSRGEALRNAIALEESLDLKDLLFEDLQSLVKIAPDDTALIEKLIKVGREIGQLDKVSGLLREAFTEHQGEEIAYMLAVLLAKVLEELGDDESAADYLRIAHLRKPQDKDIIEMLGSLFEKMGRFGDLALLYESLGDTVEGNNERVGWLHLAQKVLRERIGDSGSAIEVLKKILAIEPEDMDAIEALIQEARKASDYENLVFGLEIKAHANIPAREKVKTLLELGKLLDEALGNSEKAVSAVEEAFAIDKSNSESREFLKDLYAETKNFEKLVEILETEAGDAESDTERVEVLKKIAALYESQLSNIEMAKAALRRILAIEPRNGFATTRLENILETEGDYKALLDLLDFKLKHAGDKNEATALHCKAGQVLLEKLDAPQEAIARFKAGVALNPYDKEPRKWLEKMLQDGSASMEACLALEELYENTGEHLKLCEVLRKEVSLLESAREKEGILLRISEILQEKLEDKGEAFSVLCEAFSLNPESEETFGRLEKIAKETGRVEDLYMFARGVAVNEKDSELKAKLLWRCGQIAETELDDLKRAADMFAAFLEIKEGDPDALVKLDEIYSKLGYNNMLAEILRRRIGQGVGDEATLRMRLAEVLGTYLGDAQGAVEHLGEVLRHRPHDKEVIRRLSTYVDNEAVGARALELLIQVLEESEDLEGLLWAYSKAVLVAERPEEKAVLHRKAGEAARQLGKKNEEFEQIGGLVLIGHCDKDDIERFVRLADELKLTKEAYEGLEKGAVVAVSGDVEKEMRLAGVRLLKRLETPPAEAEKHLKRVLEIDGQCVEALNELEKLYVSEGRTKDTIALLYARLRLDIGTKERLDLLCRLGGLHESLGEHEKAADCLEEVIAIESSDLETLRKLCRLYESLENYEKLVDCLTMLAHETKDERERSLSLLKATDLLVERVGDEEAARTVLESLFAEAKQDIEVIRRLEKVYQDTKDFEALKNLYVEVITNVEDERIRLDTAMKAAVLAEKELHDPAFAIAMYKKALEMQAGFLPAMDELIRIYYKTQDWSQYLEALRKKAETVRTLGEKVALLAKACDVAVSQLNDLQLASNVASDILAIDSTNPTALLIKAKVMESRGESDEALDLFKRLAIATGNVDERVEALCGIARLLLGKGEATNEVREALRTAVRFKPDNPEISRLQKLLFIENKEHKALIEVLQKELKQAKSDEQRASVCMEIAGIYLNELNDGQKFLQWAEEAFRYKSDDPQIVQALVNFHLRSGDSRRAVPLLEWLVNYLEGKRMLRELPKYAYELARLLEAQGDAEKAIQYYRVCHEHDAQNVANSLALGRLYTSRGEHEKALKVYQPLTLKIDNLEQNERIEVFLQLARIYESRGDKKKARHYVMRVLAEEPENADAQAFLKKGV